MKALPPGSAFVVAVSQTNMQDIYPSRQPDYRQRTVVNAARRVNARVPARPTTVPPRPAVSMVGLDISAPKPAPKPSPSPVSQPASRMQATPETIPSRLSSEEKKSVLEQALKAHKVKVASPSRKKAAPRLFGLLRSRHAFTALVVAVIAVTGYVSIDTWVTNRQVEKISTAAEVAGVSDDTQQQEGKDETPVTPEVYQRHVVGPDEPRYLTIEKLGIEARVLQMGLNRDNSIQAPININDAGWYNQSVKPGSVGAVFLDGHAAGQLRQGLFAYLDTLAPGDRLSVETGDGTVYTYEVLKSEITALEDTDMRKALLPQNGTLRGLNLMTCIGEYIPEKNTYDQRLIVYTKQV